MCRSLHWILIVLVSDAVSLVQCFECGSDGHQIALQLGQAPRNQEEDLAEEHSTTLWCQSPCRSLEYEFVWVQIVVHGSVAHDVILTGPDLNITLLGLRIQFRYEVFAFTADIEQVSNKNDATQNTRWLPHLCVCVCVCVCAMAGLTFAHRLLNLCAEEAGEAAWTSHHPHRRWFVVIEGRWGWRSEVPLYTRLPSGKDLVHSRQVPVPRSCYWY